MIPIRDTVQIPRFISLQSVQDFVGLFDQTKTAFDGLLCDGETGLQSLIELPRRSEVLREFFIHTSKPKSLSQKNKRGHRSGPLSAASGFHYGEVAKMKRDQMLRKLAHRSSVKPLFSPVPLLPNVSLQRKNFVLINPPQFGLEIVRQRGDTHMIKTIKSKHAEDILLISVCIIACLGLYFLAAYFFVTFFR
jgi:hypothetical protein